MPRPVWQSAPDVASDMADRLTDAGISRVEGGRRQPYDAAQQGTSAWPVIRVYGDRHETTPASTRSQWDELHTIKIEIVAQGRTHVIAQEAVIAAEALVRAALLTDATWLALWSQQPRIAVDWTAGNVEQGSPAVLCSMTWTMQRRGSEYVIDETTLQDLLLIVNNTYLVRVDQTIPETPDVGFDVDIEQDEAP